MTAPATAVDVALVGGGGAAHCLLHALAGAGVALSVAVLDPVSHQGNDRTWCFWDRGTSPVEPAVRRRWPALRVVGPDGVAHQLAPVSYAMVRSADFYRLVRDRCAAGGLDVRWLSTAVHAVRPAGDLVRLATDAGELTARWVFDSRPRPPDRPGATTLLQHFRGRWLVGARLDRSAATLMDFTVPQPESGLAFGYLLPVDERRALVEYTVFSRSRLASEEYDVALSRLCDRLGVGTATVESTEDGVIPMTDGGFARRAAPRVYRLGTAGGATRPATGYTFATMLRQATVVAARLAAGVEPVPPRPYPVRHLRYDAILLRAVDRGLVDGRRLFTDLLTRHPPARILGFLDGTSTRRDEARILAGTPIPAMMRATAGWLAGTVRR
ncbi:lycopene cyclase [Actinocatenispora thailandica]|uniref:Lycopene cyclase n=1 Tax=Actinocatenispora thailandica TaxID=227318 RepID=A0A7R7HUQ7_9ACTN|nr:lycopene cyclase family protein [Actinocatenispora thailandica]BCJ32898.1 lycopene cyclase [Actinocatenispora thailandica]